MDQAREASHETRPHHSSSGHEPAELEPDQEAALRRLRAAFGFIMIVRIVDHDDGQAPEQGAVVRREAARGIAADTC